MRLYADHPVRRARQLLADLLALGWLVLAVALGRAVHAALSAAAEPLRRVADVGRELDRSMSSAAGTAADVPIVGERLGRPLRDAAAAGQRLSDAGLDGVALIETLAVVVGVLVALLPALLVLVPWLVLRLRYARGAGEARRLADDPAGRDLLALRALVTQSPARLLGAGADPVAAWRAADPETSRRLAALELARWGLRP